MLARVHEADQCLDECRSRRACRREVRPACRLKSSSVTGSCFRLVTGSPLFAWKRARSLALGKALTSRVISAEARGADPTMAAANDWSSSVPSSSGILRRRFRLRRLVRVEARARGGAQLLEGHAQRRALREDRHGRLDDRGAACSGRRPAAIARNCAIAVGRKSVTGATASRLGRDVEARQIVPA